MASKVFTVMLAGVLISTVCSTSIDPIVEVSTDKPDNYPDQFFEEHVKEMKLVLKNRYENEPSRTVIYDSLNCDKIVSIIQPFVVTSNNTNKLVVQSNSFQQFVKQTECYTNYAPCFQNIFKPSISMTCTSTNGSFKLYVYDPLRESYQHETYSFPVCCSCSIKSNI